MAGLEFSASSGHVALVSATAKTVVAVVAPANQAVEVLGMRLFGDSAAGGTDAAIKWRLTANAAASGTATTATAKPTDQRVSTTIQSVVKQNFTVEPTTPTDLLDYGSFNPEGGPYEVYFPAALIKVVAPGGQLNVEFTSVSGTPNCGANLFCRE